MSILLDRDFLQSVEDLAFEQLSQFEDVMVEAMIDNKGLTYGDIELGLQERILKYLQDDMSGVNDQMAQIEPDEAAKRRTQFIKDVREAGLL